MFVQTKKPLFSNNKLFRLLENKGVYRQRASKIKSIKNAFVTFDGLVFKNLILEKSSAFNLRGFKDKNFYFVFWREAFEKYLVSKFGKSIPVIQLSDKYTYLLIHSKWFNYSFWINAYLPRLIQFVEQHKLTGVKLIYPENWDQIPYVSQSLTLFSIEKEVVPLDHQLFIPNLTFVELRDYTASFYPASILNTTNFIKDKFKFNSNFPFRNVYLTRRKRGVRSVENESEVISLLRKYDFQIVTFEDLSFLEQVKLMHETKLFISIHGAGFSNLMFMQPQSYVVELINEQYANMEYTFPFWKLASASDVNYSGLLCDVNNQSTSLLGYGKKKNVNENDYLVNANIVVPLDEMEEIILTILNDSSEIS